MKNAFQIDTDFEPTVDSRMLRNAGVRTQVSEAVSGIANFERVIKGEMDKLKKEAEKESAHIISELAKKLNPKNKEKSVVVTTDDCTLQIHQNEIVFYTIVKLDIPEDLVETLKTTFEREGFHLFDNHGSDSSHFTPCTFKYGK